MHMLEGSLEACGGWDQWWSLGMARRVKHGLSSHYALHTTPGQT